jgi:predicted amidohydrolase YtcJ
LLFLILKFIAVIKSKKNTDKAKATSQAENVMVPEGQWVKVTGGWSPYQFKENRQPTIDELNKAVSNRPLYVQ